MRRVLFLLAGLLALTAAGARAGSPPSELTEAVARWAGERDRWAFTQTVKEFEGDEVKQARLETYDPSRPIAQRWALVDIDGREPTSKERADWDKRKNKKRKRDAKPLIEYFDFERATLLDEAGPTARFEVPLTGTANWLFSVEKVRVIIAINRPARAVEKIDATISEPFKVALGLARVLDFELQLHMQPLGEGDPAEPAATEPNGTVHAVVNKLGQRVEYRWSEFRRVTPHPEWAQFAGPR